jgi:hypothetical protein
LPPNLPTEGEAFVPGWRVVKNFDNYFMQRKIRETNLEIPAVAWRQGNQADGQGTTRNLTQGRRADSGRDKRPEIQFDGNLCARFQVILWSAVSQHLRKSSAFSTQHGCLMAGGRSNQDMAKLDVGIWMANSQFQTK